MSHRYQTPEHTSEIFTSTGPKRADKSGIITLAADAPASDHAELRRAGCEAIGGEAKSASKPSSSKGPAKKSSGKSKPAGKSPARRRRRSAERLSAAGPSFISPTPARAPDISGVTENADLWIWRRRALGDSSH
jgi:hypothetical protein